MKLRFYIEVLAIALGLTVFLCVIPIQVYENGQPRVMTVGLGMILWYIIFTRNETFHLLTEKWLKK